MRPQVAQVNMKLVVSERSFIRKSLFIVHVAPKRKRTMDQDKLVQEKGERNVIPLSRPHTSLFRLILRINRIIRRSGMPSFHDPVTTSLALYSTGITNVPFT